jgi:putative endonuclease
LRQGRGRRRHGRGVGRRLRCREAADGSNHGERGQREGREGRGSRGLKNALHHRRVPYYKPRGTLVSWHVYILRCGDGSLYTGIAVDAEKRLAQHRKGRGARYTKGRGPLSMVYLETVESHGAALRREAAIRKLGRAGKEALLAASLTKPALDPTL